MDGIIATDEQHQFIVLGAWFSIAAYVEDEKANIKLTDMNQNGECPTLNLILRMSNYEFTLVHKSSMVTPGWDEDWVDVLARLIPDPEMKDVVKYMVNDLIP